MRNEPNLKVDKSTVEDDDDLKLAEMEAEGELSLEIIEKRKKGLLRTGYTTGTSASAATKAALLALISSHLYNTVEVVLPKSKIAKLKITSPNLESAFKKEEKTFCPPLKALEAIERSSSLSSDKV